MTTGSECQGSDDRPDREKCGIDRVRNISSDFGLGEVEVGELALDEGDDVRSVLVLVGARSPWNMGPLPCLAVRQAARLPLTVGGGVAARPLSAACAMVDEALMRARRR